MIPDWIPGWDFRSAELFAPLPPARCIERLQASVGRRWNPFDSKDVVGTVGEKALRLRVNLGYGRINHFQTILRARLEDEGIGVRISCRFRLTIFIMMFVTLCPVVGIVLIVPLVASRNWDAIPPQLGVLAGGAILMAWGRYRARKERGQLLDFLRTTLNARDVGPRTPGPLG